MGACKSALRYCFPSGDTFTSADELQNRSHVSGKAADKHFGVDARIRHEYEMMDEDGSGALSFAEVAKLMMKLNYNVPKAKLQKMF